MCNCTNKVNKELEIKIKKVDKDLPDFKKLEVGDWIDVRVSKIYEVDHILGLKELNWDEIENILLYENTHYVFSLGFACQVPEGYEAYLLPRSSTFKNWGLLLTNSMGVIDQSYSGEKDIYMASFFTTKSTTIKKYARIAQFRIQEIMPKIKFSYVDNLDNKSRGGFGSTGRE